MMLAALLATVSVVFPPEGAKLPNLSRCYVMGAADCGEEALVISGLTARVSSPVPVSRSGAWATVIDVVPGTNVVEIGDARRTFVVESLVSLGSLGSKEAKGSKGEKGEKGSLGSKGEKGEKGSKGTKGAKGADEKRVYKKLEYAADKPKPHPTGKKPGEITVVLDAGHGGGDMGAMSPHGLPEKDANLRLAKAVRDELVKRGYKVVMTREDDTFVALYDRPKVAHAAQADLFVSIHHNAPGYSTNPLEMRYQAVYAWNPLGERLAKAINASMAAADSTLRNEGILHANFAVTRNPEIPSCLIEADFITHPDGECAAWDASRRPRLATAIVDGIAAWAGLRDTAQN